MEERFLEMHKVLIEEIVLKNIGIKEEQLLLKNLREELQGELINSGLERAENDLYKIMMIKATLNTTIDLRAFEKKEPVLYVRLLSDYLQTLKRKEYLKVAVKEGWDSSPRVLANGQLL